MDELEAGGVLEAGDGPARDAASPQRDVEAPERRLGVGAFEVVALAEQRRVAAAHGCLAVALTPGNRTQGVEPARDRGDEAPLALHIGGDGPEQRRRSLVRPVGAPEALDGLVRPPARFQQIVDPSLGVGRGQVRVIAAAGPARHREHQDTLGRVHERGGLGEIGGGGPAAKRQALAPGVGDLQHPARPARDLGDGLVPEAVHDLVERRLHRRQCRQLLDERVAPRHGLLAEHGVAVVVEHRPAHDVAVVVRERLLQLDREGMGEEFDDGFARGEVHREVVPFRCRDLGDAPFHERLAGRDELDDRRPAGIEIGLDRADQARALHGGQQVAEEALLRALEGAHRGRLGIPVQRRLVIDDTGRLERLLDVLVDDLEGPGV